MSGGLHWVKPGLVAEIAFAEFPAEGVVRHASFIGLRGDKSAKEVVPARPVSTPEDNAPTSAAKITKPDLIIFPGFTFSKGQPAAYYLSVSSILLPCVGNQRNVHVVYTAGRARQSY